MSNRISLSRIVLGLLVVTIIGCSSEPAVEQPPPAEESEPAVAQLSPAETASAFMDAAMEGDEESVKTLLIEKAVEGIESGESGMDMNNMTVEEYTVGETTETDESTNVAIEAINNGETQNLIIKMRQENDVYKIFALGISLG